MGKIIVIGTSAGGIDALLQFFLKFKNVEKIPVVIVQHIQAEKKSQLKEILQKVTHMTCVEVEMHMKIEKNTVYLPTANYHTMIEKDFTISLSQEEKVLFARPSIDVLFETVADAGRKGVIGILLTGANKDGAMGLKEIKKYGGYTIVQDPKEAYMDEMPKSALEIMQPDVIAKIEDIPNIIEKYVRKI